MFAVVQDQQRVFTPQIGLKCLNKRFAPLFADAQDGGDALIDQRWIAERRKLNQSHAIAKTFQRRGTHFQG